MLNRSEVKSFISRFPRFEDETLALYYAPRMPKAIIKETEKVVALARKFNDEVARPLCLEIDRKTHEDPDYFPLELVKKANEWGFYTLWIPKLFGGKGYNMPSLSYFLEEIGSVCVGISNVIGVHYLGMAACMMLCNTKVIKKVLSEVAEGEKAGDPCLISYAITEPGAGTDVEEVELEARGRLGCQAKKVKGGYLLNGSKVFISNGHLSKWSVVYAYTDLKRGADTKVALMVKQGMKGFSLGRHENKMGQRACPASVLNFEDCFVPDELVAVDADSIKSFTKKSPRDMNMQHIDYVFSLSRAGVGAFGIGAARGAFEAALRYANETEIDGKPMVCYEWVQCRLAEMYANVRLGRLAYNEANLANQHRGTYNLLQMKPIYYYLKYTPLPFFSTIISPLLNTSFATWLLSKWYIDWQKPGDQHLTTGLASMAKFSCTDFGVRNCQMALELMGKTGLRQDNGAEKILRDAKLLQIYEGTNQLNRINLFKSIIAPASPKAAFFEE
ncbi:MAG TPA: acyl-CoA dehydrogenase family protein [Smithellaceae bacterium]|nr:acyl-CoA dehydrogenase family protein [Smithellaceae bacterium]HPL66120.1 acyl-CoA dehydrogenase family protein [Smithellaceae bacterium]